MAPSAALALFFRLVAVVATLVTALRLYRFGLHRKYPVFFSYLIFSAIHVVALLAVPVKSLLYFYIWVFAEPVVWLFYVLLVLELYSLVLANHKGLYSVGKWVFSGGLALSVALSWLVMLPNLSVRRSPLLTIFFVVERGLVFSLAIFLLIILVLLARFPIPLTRNVILHAGIFSGLFLSNTLGLIFYSAQISAATNAVLMGVSAACVLLWMLFMDERGEKTTFHLPYIGREQEQRLVAQLNTLNSTVLRAGRIKQNLTS